MLIVKLGARLFAIYFMLPSVIITAGIWEEKQTKWIEILKSQPEKITLKTL